MSQGPEKQISMQLKTLAGPALLALACHGPAVAADGSEGNDHEGGRTATPIKHVIVLIGENRTFDHVFATYVPRARIRSRTCCPKGSSMPTARPARISRGGTVPSGRAVPARSTSSAWTRTRRRRTRLLPEPTLNFAPTATIFPPGTPAALLAAVEPSLEAGRSAPADHRRATGSRRPSSSPIRIRESRISTRCRTGRSRSGAQAPL